MANTNSLKKPYHVAVCGGGIGGLCLVIGLLHQSIPCTLYESAPAFAEIGAGVSFGPNAVRAMCLIDPAIKKGFDRQTTSNAFPDRKSVWFDFRMGMSEEGWKSAKGENTPAREGEHIARVSGDVGQASVHRAHFLDELVRLVPDGVAEFGKRVQNVEEKGNRMQITFHDGSTALTDVVIGCDGVKSRTRHILLGDNEITLPTFSEKYAYRGLIPMEKAVEALGEELARNSQMYLGYHGHILTFPIEHGETMNVVAFRHKFDGKWLNDQWVLPTKKEDMLSDFAGWGSSAKSILSLMEKPDVWALFDHPPAPTYAKGRFAILGDAAHASTPHQGAGAGQAIEDVFVLSNLLGRTKEVKDVERALYAYDQVRRPRSQRVVTTSRDAASIYEFENEKLGIDLHLIRRELEERLDWIWNEDLEQQLRKAEDIMGLKAHL